MFGIEYLLPFGKLNKLGFMKFRFLAFLIILAALSSCTSYKELTDGKKLKTVNGKELVVQIKDGSVFVNGAKIQGRDIEADNGVIHSMDKVVVAN